MAFSGAFSKPFRSMFDAGLAAVAAAPWWYVAGKTCVAAYQPKGAASLAASYSNLANPGTYDAAPGTAPTWDATNGWIFNGSTQYLTTGVVPANDQTWSYLIRFSNPTIHNRALGLSRTGSGTCDFGFYRESADKMYFYNGQTVSVTSTGAFSSGVLGVAGNKPYLNGTSLTGTIPSGSGTPTVGFPIGCMVDDGAASLYSAAYVQALVLYSATLTAGEVATVSAAMAAL